MAQIVEGPKLKRVTCQECEAVMEYLPEEVERHDGTDYAGGSSGYERVRCPRAGCTGYGYVRSW